MRASTIRLPTTPKLKILWGINKLMPCPLIFKLLTRCSLESTKPRTHVRLISLFLLVKNKGTMEDKETCLLQNLVAWKFMICQRILTKRALVRLDLETWALCLKVKRLVLNDDCYINSVYQINLLSSEFNYPLLTLFRGILSGGLAPLAVFACLVD